MPQVNVHEHYGMWTWTLSPQARRSYHVTAVCGSGYKSKKEALTDAYKQIGKSYAS